MIDPDQPLSALPLDVLGELLATISAGMRDLSRNGKPLSTSTHALVGYWQATHRERCSRRRVATVQPRSQSPDPSWLPHALTTAEVARIFGVGVQQARRMGRRSLPSGSSGVFSIPGTPGKHRLFDPDAVMRLAGERGRA